MKKFALALGAIMTAGAVSWWVVGPDWRALLSNPPSNTDILFWGQTQRNNGFRMLDRLPVLVKARTIEASGDAMEFEQGAPLALGIDINAYAAHQRLAGLVVVHDGALRLEHYGLDFEKDERWTSFSVAKSVTSTLVGAALHDGHIRSLDDKVSNYIAGLSGSAYDDVTIEQLLTMTSGVAWNEDYEDAASDVARFDKHKSSDETRSLVSYMKTLPRAHPPGEVWNYSTGETNLIGVLVVEATGRPLADYLSDKVWKPAGMANNATWLLSDDGDEISGCCIQAATRDFARFGQFILDGAVIDGAPVLPEGWIENASATHAVTGSDHRNYGYQWWTYGDGAFGAIGIFGQGVFIDPKRRLVIASNSSWSTARGRKNGEYFARLEFYRAVQDAVDRERDLSAGEAEQ